MDSRLSKPRILYIEDTPDARALVTRLLGDKYIVLEAGEPLNGIELAKDTNPDLVLLDINLPDMSGREIATRLKTLLPNTPLVAVTADATPGARERALAAGFIGFISKPINVDAFPDQILAYLNGKKEFLEDKTGKYIEAHQAEIVMHLEEKVRELTRAAQKNDHLHKQNKHVINILKRRQSLLEAAAQVGRSITSILNMDRLLRETVDIICEEYGFYYAGIFLLDETKRWAVLRAGHGDHGQRMMAADHKLEVNKHSMVGRAIINGKARISSDVGEDQRHYKNPYLPQSRSEMTLPLIFKDVPLGVLSVQSEDVDAFTEEDLTTLQSLADQVAVAIRNAELLRELDIASRELVRTKTFEAIATATGEAIHWVGNKAAPIPASSRRVREDIGSLLAIAKILLDETDTLRKDHPLWPILQSSFDVYAQEVAALDLGRFNLNPARMNQIVDIRSILEDLEIIEKSAGTILNIKEDLIGPVREQTLKQVNLPGLLHEIGKEMGFPKGVLVISIPSDLPPVFCDPMQISRVFINLLKNAWEALEITPEPKIKVKAKRKKKDAFIEVTIRDNGPGIPPALFDKIWVSFFTTKGNKGGTGLGLAACMEIVKQTGGSIWAENPIGGGASFHVLLPIDSGA